MKIIEVLPSKRMKGWWTAFEGTGVDPTFLDQRQALDHARQRFGGRSGEIHVYDEAGDTIVEKIPMNGGTQDGQPH